MELRPPLHLGVVAIEKGAFGSPSTMVANFTYIYIYIYICILEWFTALLVRPRICRLYSIREIRPWRKVCPKYDTFNQLWGSNSGENRVTSSLLLFHWSILIYVLCMTLNCIQWWSFSFRTLRVWSTPSLPLFLGHLWPVLVVPISPIYN